MPGVWALPPPRQPKQIRSACTPTSPRAPGSVTRGQDRSRSPDGQQGRKCSLASPSHLSEGQCCTAPTAPGGRLASSPTNPGDNPLPRPPGASSASGCLDVSQALLPLPHGTPLPNCFSRLTYSKGVGLHHPSVSQDYPCPLTAPGV